MIKQSHFESNEIPKIGCHLAAEYIGVSYRTLTKWAVTGRPFIPYYKIGGKVVYKKSDLDNYLAQCRIETSSLAEDVK